MNEKLRELLENYKIIDVFIVPEAQPGYSDNMRLIIGTPKGLYEWKGGKYNSIVGVPEKEIENVVMTGNRKGHK